MFVHKPWAVRISYFHKLNTVPKIVTAYRNKLLYGALSSVKKHVVLFCSLLLLGLTIMFLFFVSVIFKLSYLMNNHNTLSTWLHRRVVLRLNSYLLDILVLKGLNSSITIM